MSNGRVVPPKGTYVYPDGPAAGNGADIFRVAIGLTETAHLVADRLEHLAGPVGADRLFTFDTGRGRADRRAVAGRGGSSLRRASIWPC